MPRAKGQPVTPRKNEICLDCLGVNFHRMDCPKRNKPARGGKRSYANPRIPIQPAQFDEESDDE